MNKLRLPAFLFLVFLILAGCEKKAASATTGHAVPDVSSVNGTPVVPVTLADNADPSAQLARLTQMVRKFSMERQRAPQSLNDLVSAGYLTGLPSAPAGRQFIIDASHMQVVLN